MTTPPNQGQKSRVTIITCDPTQRLLQGQLKDGGKIGIAVFDIPPAFRWPVIGEIWTIYRENFYWRLGSLVAAPSGAPFVEQWNPGDVGIYAPTGAVRISGGTYEYTSTRKFVTTVGDGSHKNFVVKHGMNTVAVNVRILDNGTTNLQPVFDDIWTVQDANNVFLSFIAAPGVNAYQVVVFG